MAHADSPTNLLWRLHNDTSPQSKVARGRRRGRRRDLHRHHARRDARGIARRAARLRAVPMSAALRLAEALIARRCVTPDDGGCQALLAERLAAIGFVCEAVACRPGRCPRAQPVGVAPGQRARPDAGLCRPHRRGAHRPAGAMDYRSVRAHPPRRPAVRPRRGRHEDLDRGDGGGERGVRRAAARPCRRDRPADHQRRRRPGPGRHRAGGGAAAPARSAHRCLHRRRTDLGAAARRHGQERPPRHLVGPAARQGRAGPHRLPAAGRNPIHRAAPALAELVAMRWDEGNEFFPPTSWQMSNIHAGTGAGNVIPGELELQFNFRFSNQSTPASLKSRVHAVLDRHGLDYALDWTLGGETFLTPPGTLSEALAAAIEAEMRAAARAVDHRRHLRRPLHRAHLPAGGRVRPAQRHHPQDRRACRGGQHRAAEEHLPPHAGDAVAMTLIELVERSSARLEKAGVCFGHGTNNAFDEAAWLVLWRLGLPLDDLDGVADAPVSAQQRAQRGRAGRPAHRHAQARGLPDRRSLAAGRALRCR